MNAGERLLCGTSPYLNRLELLASTAVVEELLGGWTAQRSESVGSWRRIYGKLRPQRSLWALLVYQADDGTTVAVRLTEDDSRPAGPLGRVEIMPCVEDPALPGLPVVMAALEGPRVVRYHPGNRCVLRGGSGAGARFVKVLSEEADDQVEARARWDASVSGVLSFAVAEPHGWDEPTQASWYGVVPGDPIEGRLLGPQGADIARRVGRSLGELAVAPLQPAAKVDSDKQLARTTRSVTRAVAAAPALEGRLRRALDALSSAHEGLGPRPLVPAHGAAHLGQWLVDDTGRLGLVDFDRFARGEPEFDMATFLVELRALAGPVAQLEAALVDGYRAVAGELDESRLELYLQHKRLARVARTAAGLRPGGEERAARQLDDIEAAAAVRRFA